MDSMIDFSSEILPPVLLIVEQPVKAPVLNLSCPLGGVSIIWCKFFCDHTQTILVHGRIACNKLEQVTCHRRAFTIYQELTKKRGTFAE
jgi:hypothetical protein